MNPGLRILVFACLAGVAAAVTFVALRPARPAVTIAAVDRGVVEEIVRAPGRTHVRRRHTVIAPFDGYLPALPWHAGDRVRAGEALLQMQPARAPFDPLVHEKALTDAARARDALDTVQASAEATRLHAEFAQAEHARIAQAFSTGAATREDLDLAEQMLNDACAHLRAVEFEIDIARHDLDLANLRVEHAREDASAAKPVPLRAPLGGIVLSVAGGGNAGGDGMTTAGTALLEIGDPATLEIHVEVTTADALRLERGSVARIAIGPDAAALQGRIRRIEPAAFTAVNARGDEEQRVRVAVEITSPRKEWARLGDDYPVNVDFVAWRGADVVRAPASALYRQEDRWMVLRVRGGRAYGTPVVVGHRGERYAEILHGVAPDDLLVLDPEGVADGARVLLPR